MLRSGSRCIQVHWRNVLFSSCVYTLNPTEAASRVSIHARLAAAVCTVADVANTLSG